MSQNMNVLFTSKYTQFILFQYFSEPDKIFIFCIKKRHSKIISEFQMDFGFINYILKNSKIYFVKLLVNRSLDL